MEIVTTIEKAKEHKIITSPYELAGDKGNFKSSAHNATGSSSNAEFNILETRSTLETLTNTVMVIKGLLRLIPDANRQRTLDVFEGFYGIRGEDALSASDVGKKWKLSKSGVDRVVMEIWKRLLIAKSPIKTGAELRNTLTRIRTILESLGEDRHFHFTSYFPNDEMLHHLTLEFNQVTAKPNRNENGMEGFGQLELDFAPIIGKTAEETINLNLSRAFGFKTLYVQTDRRTACNIRLSSGQYLAAHILCDHLGRKPECLEKTTCMRYSMVRHACASIRSTLRNPTSPVAMAITRAKQLCFVALKRSGQFECLSE